MRSLTDPFRPTAVGRLRPLWRITFSSAFIYLGALQSIVA